MNKPRYLNELKCLNAEGEQMYLCLCCAVTESEFREAVKTFHITSPRDIKGMDLIGGFCNKCIFPAIQILKDIDKEST